MRSPLLTAAKLVLMLSFAATVVGCPDKKPKYPTCEKDADCKDGEKCVNKRCQQCAEHTDCPSGQACESGACVAKEGFCTTDGDCPGGKLCKNNQCTACTSDAECGPDKRCSNGACLARGACNVDEDCADDEDCIDGKCQRPGRSAPPDVTCELQTVYFDFDSFAVEGDAGSVVEKNAECIKEAPEGRALMLYGHTDPRGTEEYNVALSEKRGNAVADYLARLGIDPARLNVIPKGEGLASGTDESTWSQDRRVELEWK